jgi:hypothetical protein
MKIEILRYRKWDQTKGAFVEPSDLATREYIVRIRAEPIENSRRIVEDWLVDLTGRAILDPGTEEASELKHLADRGGSLTSLGHRKTLRTLVDFGLALSHENGEGVVEYKLTDRGIVAVREMML